MRATVETVALSSLCVSAAPGVQDAPEGTAF